MSPCVPLLIHYLKIYRYRIKLFIDTKATVLLLFIYYYTFFTFLRRKSHRFWRSWERRNAETSPCSISWILSLASWECEKPCGEVMSGSHPALRSTRQVCRWPQWAARCSAVWPRLSTAFTCTKQQHADRKNLQYKSAAVLARSLQ